MATQESDLMCENLVRKLTTGLSLDESEKSHLAECENCMSQIVKTLDESAMRMAHAPSSASRGTNGDLTHTRPEAKKALELGRQVFEREFGIVLLKE